MVNKVYLVGNVGKDPEVRHIESGVSVANFSIATNESYKNKSGDKKTLKFMSLKLKRSQNQNDEIYKTLVDESKLVNF